MNCIALPRISSISPEKCLLNEAVRREKSIYKAFPKIKVIYTMNIDGFILSVSHFLSPKHQNLIPTL